jgi:CspA family cold shock protein
MEVVNTPEPTDMDAVTPEVTQHDTMEETTEIMDVMHEVKDSDTVGEYVGQCKWFNNSYGYGFITIWDGPEKGTDIFVHHSGIKPLNSMYKTLKKGEYVMFDISSGNKGKQAVNVRGINNGPLLCDHIQVKKTPVIPGVPPPGVPQGTNWTPVSYKKKLPPMHPGIKRKRTGHVDTSMSPVPTESS